VPLGFVLGDLLTRDLAYPLNGQAHAVTSSLPPRVRSTNGRLTSPSWNSTVSLV
jgi:hypothetical protein